jgi:hypothetical protein
MRGEYHALYSAVVVVSTCLILSSQVNQSTLAFTDGNISTSGDRQVAVWASGLNTTALLNDIWIENKNSTTTFGLVAENQAIIRGDLIRYSSEQRGSCAFVADGGGITIHQSVAHTSAEESAIFCSLGGGNRVGTIHGQEVAAVSDNGPAVVLSGNTWLAAFTNCTFSAGGAAAVISTLVPGSQLDETILHFTNSQVTATGPSSPVFLFTFKRTRATVHRTNLIPSASNLLTLVSCSRAEKAGDCTPFRVAVLVSESAVSGDIQA